MSQYPAGPPPGGPYYGQPPYDPYAPPPPQGGQPPQAPPGDPYFGQPPGADPYAPPQYQDQWYGQQGYAPGGYPPGQAYPTGQGYPPGYPPAGYWQPAPPVSPRVEQRGGSGAAIVGIFLVLLGLWFLFRDEIGLDFGRVWPVVAVALGVLMVLAAFIPRRRA